MDNVYHPIADINSAVDKSPTPKNNATSVIKLKQGTLTITKPSTAVTAKNVAMKAVQQKKSSKNVNKPKLGQPPDKDVSSRQMPPPRTPKQTQPKQQPEILVENFVPIPRQKMVRAGMDLLLPNIFGKTDEKVVFSSEVIQKIDINIKLNCGDNCITEKTAINICVKPKENACHFPFI